MVASRSTRTYSAARPRRITRIAQWATTWCMNMQGASTPPAPERSRPLGPAEGAACRPDLFHPARSLRLTRCVQPAGRGDLDLPCATGVPAAAHLCDAARHGNRVRLRQPSLLPAPPQPLLALSLGMPVSPRALRGSFFAPNG